MHWGKEWTGEAPVYGSDAEMKTPQGPLSDVFQYWKAKRGDRIAPARNEIDPIDLGRSLRNVILVEPLPDGDYFYRVVGTAIVDTLRFESSRERLSSLSGLVDVERIKLDFDDLVSSFQPRYDFGRAPWQEMHWRIYHRLLLPISEDGQKVSFILGCIETEIGY